MKQNQFTKTGSVKKITGSILLPQMSGLNIIVSLSDINGELVDPQLSVFDKKWAKIRAEIKSWYALRDISYRLGNVKMTPVQSNVWICHTLCFNKTIDETALDKCAKEIAKQAAFESASVHVDSSVVALVPNIVSVLEKHCIPSGVSICVYSA
jgi:hypothetical protein